MEKKKKQPKAQQSPAVPTVAFGDVFEQARSHIAPGPTDRSYTLVRNRVYVGANPGHDRQTVQAVLDRLVKAGVRVLVNLMEPDELKTKRRRAKGRVSVPYDLGKLSCFRPFEPTSSSCRSPIKHSRSAAAARAQVSHSGPKSRRGIETRALGDQDAVVGEQG